MHRLACWAALALGCSPTPPPAAPTPAPASSAPGDAAPTPISPPDAALAARAPASYRCIYDATQERVCIARGAGFQYGPTPFIYCSGVAAPTGALAEQHAKDQEKAPCVCNNLVAIQQERAQCAMVPSAPR